LTHKRDNKLETEESKNQNTPPIRLLMTVVIQLQDIDGAIRALNELNVSVTHLSTTGGFLGQRNATLLIGLPYEQEQSVLRALEENCHRRIEYLATPLEGAPFPMPLTTPVTVGGATIFTFEVERYEEY
jgi:uncharacterized protein YaaQ